MKNTLFVIALSFLITNCKKENSMSDNKQSATNDKQTKNILKKEVDTFKIGILNFKKNKTKDDQFQMLKYAAFCLCTNNESQEIINSNIDMNYKLISDRSFVSYAEQSGLDVELFYKNNRLNKLIKDWNKKQYNIKPNEEASDSKSFIIQMKCFDFYNSKELNNYLDSIKSVD